MLGWYKLMYLTMTILCSLNDIMTNIYLPLLWNSAMTDFLILVQFFENYKVIKPCIFYAYPKFKEYINAQVPAKDPP